MKSQFHLVLPTGTQVLTRPGTRVGVVVHAPADPDHAYRVRFPDGTEQTYTRRHLTIYRHEAAAIPDGPQPDELLRYVAYRCVTGSQAYGLAHAGSDTDRRGFYLPPAALHWGLAGLPEQLDTGAEEVYWEAEKFVRLALKANPNVLECLYTPLVEHTTPIAQELLAIRHRLLSRHAHRTYNAYVLSQFKRLEQDLRTQGTVRWKHVMHLLRLQLSGLTLLREGFVPLDTGAHRDRLLAIRRGEVMWDEVEQWRLSLHRELDAAVERSPLPEQPDYAAANDWLLRARRRAAQEDYA